MTEEIASMAGEVLLTRGFVNKQSEHPWNMVQMERDFGELGLKVWGRHWSRLLVQIYGDDDNMIQLCDTDDKDVLLNVVDKAIAFLGSLPK